MVLIGGCFPRGFSFLTRAIGDYSSPASYFTLERCLNTSGEIGWRAIFREYARSNSSIRVD
jgi:hypothetical protein